MKGAAKSIALTAMMTAILIGGQVALSMIQGVEIVTVLLCSYACVFGARQGVLTAVAFSLLRCFLFGFIPNVIVLYLTYYSLFALFFGLLGKTKYCKQLPVVAAFAAIFTAAFTLLDTLIAPLFYGTNRLAYFAAGVPVMLTQTVSALITCIFLYLPLHEVFKNIKNSAAI